jgi:hypothetical protein
MNSMMSLAASLPLFARNTITFTPFRSTALKHCNQGDQMGRFFKSLEPILRLLKLQLPTRALYVVG